MPKKLNILFLIFLIFALFLPIFSANALNVSYPKLPGVDTPNTIEEKISDGALKVDERLSAYGSYFLILFYFIATGIVLAVFIAGGVLYLLSGVKPTLRNIANQRMQNALLGFVIVLGSYLILSLVNPQILVLQTEFKKIPPPVLPEIASSGEKAILAYSSGGEQIDEALDYLDKKMTLASMNDEAVKEYVEKALTESGDERSEFFRAEIPFLEAEGRMLSVIEISEEINAILENCGCGMSQSHIATKESKGVCAEGKALMSNEEETCENQCDAEGEGCGNSENCNLELAREKRKNLIGEWGGLKVLNYKISSEEIGFLEKTLKLKVSEFLDTNLINVYTQTDYYRELENWRNQYEDIDIQKHPSQKEQTLFEAGTPDDFTIYAPLSGKYFPLSQKGENQETMEESLAINLVSVLLRVGVEEIERVAEECLEDAFGEGEFAIDTSYYANLTQKALDEGIDNYLLDVFQMNSEEYAQSFRERLNKDLVQKSDKYYVEKCLASYRKEEMEEGCPEKSEDEEKYEECVKENCEKKEIPPDFLSNLVANTLTAPIMEQLPEKISKALKSSVLDFNFSKELKSIIENDLVDVLDIAMKGALTKSLDKQIPFLKENLKKKVSQVLPDFALIPLEKTDKFLEAQLKDLKERIDKQIENMVWELAYQITKPALDLIGDYKENNPNIFKEFSEPEKCWEDFSRGYFYNYTNERCYKATPREISDFTSGRGIANALVRSKKDGDVGAFESDFTQEALCRGAGYCWDQIGGEVCKSCKNLNLGGLAPTRENLARWGKGAVEFLVNFGEEFMVALLRTAAHTLTKYAQVWVEDSILKPFAPYLFQLSTFQEEIHNFLNSSVREALPAQISAYLGSSVEQILSDICAKKEAGGSYTIYNEKIEVSEEVGKAACGIDRELHQSLLDQLSENGKFGEKVATALNTEIMKLFDQVFKNADIDKHLNKTVAQLIWPELNLSPEVMRKLLKATPKELICGEISFIDYDCKEWSFDLTAGLLPYPSDPAGEKGYCYFLNYACQNPLKGWDRAQGLILSDFINTYCQQLEIKKEKLCSEQGISPCVLRDLTLSEEKKDLIDRGEDACAALIENSAAYTIFNDQIEHNFGDIEKKDKEKSQEIYLWLFATFTDKRVQGEIQKLALDRGMGREEMLHIATQADAMEEGQIKKLERGLQSFTAWFSSGGTVEEALTTPCLGAVEGLTGSPCEGSNMLAKNIYWLLGSGACSLVERTYLAEEKEGDVGENLKNLFITCRILTQTLEESLGIEKRLINYIKDPYNTIFSLMWTKLENYERPEPLNNLLDALFRGKISSLLMRVKAKDVGGPGWSEEQKQEFAKQANKLGEALSKDPISYLLNGKSLIYMIFKKMGKENWLQKSMDVSKWKEIQEVLAKTPTDIAAHYLTDPLNKEWALFRSPIDYIAETKIPELNNPYIDTIGKAAGITKFVYEIYGKWEDIKDSVNEAVDSVQGTIRSSLDTAFIEYPTRGVNWLIQSLGMGATDEIGDDIADRLAGKCKDATPEEKNNESCQGEKEIYNKTTKQCCNLGAALVCKDRCREIETSESCDIEKGEERDERDDGVFCCYDESCNICRQTYAVARAKNAEPKAKCEREGDERKEKTTEDEEEMVLCCQGSYYNEETDQCCVDLLTCISNKLTDFLKMLTLTIKTGLPINSNSPIFSD